jgi:hypothetical protein
VELPELMFLLKMLMSMDLMWVLILGGIQRFLIVELCGLHQEIVDESIRKIYMFNILIIKIALIFTFDI